MHFGLLIGYPLFVHLGTLYSLPILHFIALVMLVSGLCYERLKAFKISSWLWFLAVSCSALGAYYLEAAIYLLFIPPIIVPLLLFWVFGLTLLPGHTPLITQIGQQARGPLTAEMCRYTRRITQLWSLCFFLIALNATLLSWLASMELWSLFTNVITYVFVGALFIGEFVYRKYRFPMHDHPSFLEYLRIVFKSPIRKA